MIKLCFIFLLLNFSNPVESGDKNHTPETLLGYKVSTGAAPGYIQDIACKSCHPAHWDGYQEVGMSHSFLKPENNNYIEDFSAAPYFHEASKRFYKIEKKDDHLAFYRYQLDEDGNKINEFRRKVDWIIGSGNKARSYLFQTPSGELYQFPIGWYSDTQQWRMSPGFEASNHFGIQRQVRRECMFCHNAFPEVAKNSDSHWQPQTFPKELPLGTGCQRCHGPGSEHIRTVLNGGSMEQIHGAIVNPAKLPVEQRDSVCFQCHLLPAVSLIGARNIERNDYSFRPGELISDYLLHVDIKDPQRPKSDRFEINHHAYRLRQSQCFIKSQGKLTCISCHNPHKKVKPEQRINHYGSVCMSCHEKHSIKQGSKVMADDCTSCHMPQRRTQDVIEVIMTDHKISKNIASESERLAPLKRKDPIIENIELLIKNPTMTPLKDKIYTTIPLLRTLTNSRFIAYYQSLLKQSDSLNPLFYMDLAKGQINLKQFDAALESLGKVLKQNPAHLKALQLSAVAYISKENYNKAEEAINKALEISTNNADTYFNFALLNIAQKKYEQAAGNLQSAIRLNPTLARAWFYSGYLQSRNQKYLDAIKSYKKALEIDPLYQRAYLGIADTYVKIGDKQQAVRYLKHGIKLTKNKSKLEKLLAEIIQN